MKRITKVFFMMSMVVSCYYSNAQDYGSLLCSGTYGYLSFFEFWGSSSWINYGNYDGFVYENAIVFKINGEVRMKYLYKGQNSDGGRLYRYWDSSAGREGNTVLVFNSCNGTIYSTDGKTKFEKGGTAPAPSQQYNNYNNGGNAGNNNYQNNNNSGQKTCYHCNGSGNCPSCAGRGEKINQYNGSKYDCYECHGGGRCTTCSGRGWVVNYY